VAGNLRDLSVAEGNFISPVTGAHHIGHLVWIDVGVCSGYVKGALGRLRDVGTGINQCASDYLAILIENNGLGLC
jgi:hypothetical protein